MQDDISKLLNFFAKYERQTEILEESESHRLIRSVSDDLYVLTLEERDSKHVILLGRDRVEVENNGEVEVYVEKAGRKFYAELRSLASTVRKYRDFFRFRNYLIDEQARLSNYVENLSENMISLLSGIRSNMRYPIIPKNLMKSNTFFKSLKCNIVGEEYENSVILRFEYFLGIKRIEVVKTVEFTADKKSDLVLVVENILRREMRRFSKYDGKLKDALLKVIATEGDLEAIGKFYEGLKR